MPRIFVAQDPDVTPLVDDVLATGSAGIESVDVGIEKADGLLADDAVDQHRGVDRLALRLVGADGLLGLPPVAAVGSEPGERLAQIEESLLDEHYAPASGATPEHRQSVDQDRLQLRHSREPR